MTFEEAIETNRKELRRQWAARKDELCEALDNLKRTVGMIEAQMNQPIPDCNLYEIYLGSGSDLKHQSDKALRAYDGLESVKFRSKFVEDLKRAVSP